jgi:L-arabinose isomerase
MMVGDSIEEWKARYSLIKKKCSLLMKQKEVADNAVRQIGDERYLNQNEYNQNPRLIIPCFV